MSSLLISMAGKRVLLTLNIKLYDELQRRADSSYMSIQELIADILRKDVLTKSNQKKKKSIKNEQE